MKIDKKSRSVMEILYLSKPLCFLEHSAYNRESGENPAKYKDAGHRDLRFEPYNLPICPASFDTSWKVKKRLEIFGHKCT